jgi:hypothetical protein
MTPSAYRALDHSGIESVPPKTAMVGMRPSRFREAAAASRA